MRTFYDLFAGIGGFRLGLERAGFECIGNAVMPPVVEYIARNL